MTEKSHEISTLWDQIGEFGVEIWGDLTEKVIITLCITRGQPLSSQTQKH